MAIETEGVLAVIRRLPSDDKIAICIVEPGKNARYFQIATSIDNGVWRDVCDFLGITRNAAELLQERNLMMNKGFQ